MSPHKKRAHFHAPLGCLAPQTERFSNRSQACAKRKLSRERHLGIPSIVRSVQNRSRNSKHPVLWVNSRLLTKEKRVFLKNSPLSGLTVEAPVGGFLPLIYAGACQHVQNRPTRGLRAFGVAKGSYWPPWRWSLLLLWAYRPGRRYRFLRRRHDLRRMAHFKVPWVSLPSTPGTDRSRRVPSDAVSSLALTARLSAARRSTGSGSYYVCGSAHYRRGQGCGRAVYVPQDAITRESESSRQFAWGAVEKAGVTLGPQTLSFELENRCARIPCPL